MIVHRLVCLFGGTFMTDMVARERKMLMSWCSSAGLGADSLWGGWLPSLCQTSISEIEAEEPHRPTVMLTIHPHLVNERPPTLPIPFLLAPTVTFSISFPLRSPSPSLTTSPSLLPRRLRLFLRLSDSLACILLCLSSPLNFRPHSSSPLRNANYSNMKSLG